MISVELSGVTTMPLGKAIAVGHLRAEPSGVTRAMIPGASPRPGHQVEAGAVDVDVAAAVDHDLVPAVVGELAEVDVGHQRPVGLPAKQLSAA